MTALRINTAEFKHICKGIRAEIGMFDANEESIYSFYRWFVKDAEAKIFSAPADPVEELRTSLKIASRAAMQYGATDAQINFIVSLAVKNNDFNILAGGKLTKREASRIIDEMKK